MAEREAKQKAGLDPGYWSQHNWYHWRAKKEEEDEQSNIGRHKWYYVLQLQQKKPLYKHLSGAAKKLVLVSAISLSMTKASKEEGVLDRVPYIHYLLYFQKN